MKLDKIFASMALACVFGLAAGAAYAQPNYPAPVSPEQQAAAQKIFSSHYAAMESTRQSLANARAMLDDELASPNPDGAKIESLSRQIGELRGKMLSDRVNLRNELEKNGLSADIYAPDAPRRNRWDDRPEVWRHHHRHHGWGPGMMGPRGGCWGGCWNGYY